MIRARAVALGLLLLATGCANMSLGVRNRLADLGDAFPMSGAFGWGLSVSAKATPLLNVGLGFSPVVSVRAGYQDRTFHGRWYEFMAVMPWSFFLTDISPVPPRPRDREEAFLEPLPLVYVWQVRRDAPSGEGEYPGGWEPQLREWGRHPPLSRESCGAFLIPETRHELNWHDLRQAQGDPDPLPSLGSPAHATLWEVSRDGPPVPQAWDLFEVDVFAVFFGVRVGVRPVEFGDFLLGFVGLDYMSDDYDDAVATPLASPAQAAAADARAQADKPPAPPAEAVPPGEPAPEPAPADEPAPEPEPQP